jgi:uncharacterized membrane protein
VLIFLVPSRRRFVVLGDAGIHAQVGQAFWHDVSACLAASFRKGAFTDGLVAGIHLVGDRLAAHFPPAGPHVEPKAEPLPSNRPEGSSGAS